MTARKLAQNVWVDGKLHEAGSTPPKDVADQISNPKAWGKEVDDKSTDKPASKK